jgi:hypothetical protein
MMREKLLKQRKLGIAGMIVGALLLLSGYFIKQDADDKLMQLDAHVLE